MKTPKNTLKRKEREDEPYEVSRWTPLVKDLIHVKEYLALFLDQAPKPCSQTKPPSLVPRSSPQALFLDQAPKSLGTKVGG